MNDKTEIKHYWLYVLQLEQGCYYVGVTAKTPEERMKEHQSGFKAANWTKLHQPLEILDRRDLGMTTYAQAEGFENKVVRKYIRKYGIKYVRGGDLSETEDFVIVFGYPILKDGFIQILSICFLMFVILFLGLELYIKSR